MKTDTFLGGDSENLNRSVGGPVAFQGYKAVLIVCQTDAVGKVSDVKFASGMWGDMYRQDAEAVCGAHKEHTAPGEGCLCGWYGLKECQPILDGEYMGAAAISGYTASLAEIAFYGEVVEGSTGYRGQWQRINALELSPICAQDSCGRTRTVAVVGKPVDAAGHEKSCETVENQQQRVSADTQEPLLWHHIEMRCQKHSQGGQQLTLSELAGFLQCNVRVGKEAVWASKDMASLFAPNGYQWGLQRHIRKTLRIRNLVETAFLAVLLIQLGWVLSVGTAPGFFTNWLAVAGWSAMLGVTNMLLYMHATDMWERRSKTRIVYVAIFTGWVLQGVWLVVMFGNFVRT